MQLLQRVNSRVSLAVLVPLTEKWRVVPGTAALWIREIASKIRDQVKAGENVILPVISPRPGGRCRLRRFGYLDCLEPASDEKRLLQWFKTQEIAAIQQGKPISTLEACRKAVLTCVPGATRVYFDRRTDVGTSRSLTAV